jgi:hypothetical protein
MSIVRGNTDYFVLFASVWRIYEGFAVADARRVYFITVKVNEKLQKML